jgi:protein TonB
MVSIVSTIKGDSIGSEDEPKITSYQQAVMEHSRVKPKQPEKERIEEPQIQVNPTEQTARLDEIEAVQAVSASTNEDGSRQAESNESAGSQPASSGTELAATASQDELAGFLFQVRQIIERHKQYPQRARFQGLEGTTQLRFRILPNGEAAEVQIVQSSQSLMLDEEAIATVKRVARFPEPPVKSSLGIWVRLPFVFHLEKGE